jgi:hydrogenase maturation protease
VIFVDAGTGTPAPFELRRVQAAANFLHTSHALSPAAVLAVFQRLNSAAAPESWLLCIRGEGFDLGEQLSSSAVGHLKAAWPALLRLCTT